MKNIENLATEYAYKTFFKNVNKDRWPADPDKFLNKFNQETWCYFLKNKNEHMEPKEIYGTLRVGVLKELLYEQITRNLTMISKALNE